jgi:hypothetical protein
MISLTVEDLPYGVEVGGDLTIEKGTDTATVTLLAYEGTPDGVYRIKVNGSAVGNASGPNMGTSTASATLPVSATFMAVAPRNDAECRAYWVPRFGSKLVVNQTIAGWTTVSRVRQQVGSTTTSTIPDERYREWSLQFTVVQGDRVPSLTTARERIVQIGTPDIVNDRTDRYEVRYSGIAPAGNCVVSRDVLAVNATPRTYELLEWKGGNNESIPDELVLGADPIERFGNSAKYQLTMRRANLASAP